MKFVIKRFLKSVSMIKFVIDLTSNEGVSFYLKHAIIHSAKNEGFSFKLVKNPVIGIKESLERSLDSRNISEHSEILLCLLKLGLFAFKIISFFFYNREKFLSLLLSLRSKNILIGDCILSSYQRNIETKNYSRKKFRTLFVSCRLVFFNFNKH